MKINGKIKINGLQLPEASPVKAQDIEIDYDIHFSMDEATKVLELMPKCVDALAATYRKFQECEKEFGTNKSKAKDEVESALQDVSAVESK